jgi:putative ATPase
MSRDLFSDSAESQLESFAPLAQRLRPHTLDDFVGQADVVGPGSALRRAIAADRVPSMIFYGPPGSGKTTLARIVATTTQAHFEELSAVQVGVGDVRRVLGEARDRLGGNGRRTILFLDEIHRFNKGQQDALLPAVESGLLTLIGATTENPYFEVNSALLSRCQLFELMPLGATDLEAIVRRGEAALRVELEPGLREEVVRAAGGDARNALNILDAAVASAGGGQVTADHIRDAARKQPLMYDKGGDRHYDTTSAFIKSMRGSDADAALYYLATMITAGEDPKFIARRMIVFASEDVGNADPQALQVAVAAARAVEFVGLPECRINLSQAAIYLARAPKSNAAYVGIDAAMAEVRDHGAQPPPAALRDASYRGAQKLGRGVGYKYPHDFPGGVVEQQHLPDTLVGRKFMPEDDEP